MTKRKNVYEGILPDPARAFSPGLGRAQFRLMTQHVVSSGFNGSNVNSRNRSSPTLLVWGREDEVFDQKTFATRFKELLPHAEGPELVTGRHFLQEDSGAEIVEKIGDFLDRNRWEQTMTEVEVIEKPSHDGKRSGARPRGRSGRPLPGISGVFHSALLA